MAFGKKKTEAQETVTIAAPDFRIVQLGIIGTAPYVFNNFGSEAEEMMRSKMAKGSLDKKAKTALPPRDFEKDWRASLHTHAGHQRWHGIPCIAFKAAMVRAASLCGVEMTRAKQCIEVVPDGYGLDDEALVRITHGEPVRFDRPVRQGTTCTIRSRGKMTSGWKATVTIKYDSQFISETSIANLLMRAGMQVGVGAGRPFSTMSVGQGWGTFDLVSEASEQAAQ